MLQISQPCEYRQRAGRACGSGFAALSPPCLTSLWLRRSPPAGHPPGLPTRRAGPGHEELRQRRQRVARRAASGLGKGCFSPSARALALRQPPALRFGPGGCVRELRGAGAGFCPAPARCRGTALASVAVPAVAVRRLQALLARHAEDAPSPSPWFGSSARVNGSRGQAQSPEAPGGVVCPAGQPRRARGSHLTRAPFHFHPSTVPRDELLLGRGLGGNCCPGSGRCTSHQAALGRCARPRGAAHPHGAGVGARLQSMPPARAFLLRCLRGWGWLVLLHREIKYFDFVS